MISQSKLNSQSNLVSKILMFVSQSGNLFLFFSALKSDCLELHFKEISYLVLHYILTTLQFQVDTFCVSIWIMSEKFSLKWNDIQSHVTSAFSMLRTKADFQHVTFVSDDHKQISAHRVVLTACSRFFNDILRQNTHSHPLLCLDE